VFNTLRRAADFAGKNPRKRKEGVIKPDADNAATAAQKVFLERKVLGQAAYLK
jgi:hypothetical protein